MQSRTYSTVFLLLAVVYLLVIPKQLQAQETTFTISGTITNSSGIPIAGASIIDLKTQRGTSSDDLGNFELMASKSSILKISSIGYSDQKVNIEAGKFIYNIVLVEKSNILDEVITVGYGRQKKLTLTGSVSSIKNDELITTKNENVQNMLAGKIAGLRVLQNSSEPGQFNSSIDIRGFGAPLIIIDGIPRNNMNRLDPEDIESVSVIKDASGAVYGSRAANGVIIITTKRGSKTGLPSINYSGSYTLQKPSNFPDLVGAADWMLLYNELMKHNVDNSNPVPKYTKEEIDKYRNGELKSTSWKNEVFRQVAPSTQHTISASGGSETLTYYASIGYQNQGSFLKTDAINYEKYTVRSNLSAKVSKNLQMDLNLTGLIDEIQSSTYGTNDIIRSMWLYRPMDKVYYNDNVNQYGMMDWNVIINPVAMMDKDLVGGNNYLSKWFQSNISLTYSFPFLQGLSLKGFYSYDYTLNDNKEYSKKFILYLPTSKEYAANSQTSGTGKVSRYFYGKNANLWQIQLMFDRRFNNHNISLMNLLENSHYQGDNFYGLRYTVLPLPQIFAGITENQEIKQSTSIGSLYDYANLASVGRASYDFNSKYLAEFSYRYEGSSKFSTTSRWGFFPSYSAGWIISQENFWKNSFLSSINNFKLRASYGITGDDGALAYQFISGYQYPSSGSRTRLPAGYIFGSSFVSSSTNTGLANTAITWYKAKTTNIGFDAIAWEGLLGLSLDLFNRDRSGLLTTRLGSLPGIVGANLPQENLNSDQTRGFELELSHLNQLGEFKYQIKANLAYTRIKTKYFEMAKAGNSYLNWRNGLNNRYNNIWWGYSGNGRITSWEEIYNNPIYINRGTVLGDYKYLDWNGDGRISELDIHPLATNGQVPLINYGITLNSQWKGIDLNILLQGAGKKYVVPREFLYQPLWAGTNAVSDFMDRWHPENPDDDPYNPATKWIEGNYAYTGSLPDASSDFNIQNAAYIRLKTIELGYTISEKLIKKTGIKKLRVYANAYNLLTFTKLRYMDPEFFTSTTSSSGLTNLGYNYPINKTFSFGLNVKF